MSGIDQYDNPLFHRYERSKDPMYKRKIEPDRGWHSPSYSVRELAERWEVSTATIYALIKAGKIDTKIWRRRMVISIEEIEQYEKEEPLPIKKPGASLTTTQAAKQLSVCLNTMRDWIKKGKIKAFQVGGKNGHWRIEQAEVNRVMNPEKDS